MHHTTPAAEALLDQPHPVLDHGSVALVDYMGGDPSIVAAARVSYARSKPVRSDETLIRYLVSHRHTTPLESVELQFHIKAPIFVARQWFRHRTGSFSEISARYSEMTEDFYTPDPDSICVQAEDNRQGSGGPLPPHEAAEIMGDWHQGQHAAYEVYKRHLDVGLARETARLSLPVSMYTEWAWKTNFWNLLHFLDLRLDSHAQWEIRQYAQVVARCAQAVAPIAWRAFEDYILYAVTLSRQELAILKGLPLPEGLPGLGRREAAEFRKKLGT